MPNFHTHLVGGFVSGLVVIWVLGNLLLTFPSIILVAGLVFSTFFGLLPDFDKGDSRINEFVELVLICGAFVGLLAGYFLLVCLCLGILFFSKFLTHRGLFHSVWVGLGLSTLLVFVVPVWGYFAFAGWVSHLLLDYFPKL